MLHVAASALLATLLASLVASGLGAASTFFFVLGLLPLATGLAAGVGASIAHLALGRKLGRMALMGACVGILAGWFSFQAWDDHHFQSVWAQDLTHAREVTTGMPPDADFGEEGLAFFAPDASERLEEQVLKETGHRGPLGRWLLRSQSGVRLLGPWKSSRGLDVGTAGACIWSLIQLLLATWVAREVLRRIEALDSAREPNDLDDDTGHEQSTA